MPVMVLCVAVVAAFANVFGNSWHYDDLHAITQNPHLRSLQDPLRFLLDPTLFSRDADKAMFRPLLLSSFALNFAWSGLQTWSWHVVNVGLHLACCLVLWQILLSLGRRPNVALAGALLFALHPLATEPVNYISSRSESLAGLFVLGAFWLHLRARGAEDGRWRAGSVLAFALGVLTKSIAITTPVLLLASDAWRGSWRQALQPTTRRGGLLQKGWWPYAAVGLGYLVIVGAHVSRAVVSDAVRGPWEQLATQAKAVPYYAHLLTFPVGLNVHHQFFEGATALVLVASLAAVASLLYVGLRGARDITFGLFWMLVILLPTLVVPLHVLVNDHRLYLPLAGLVIALTSPALRPRRSSLTAVMLFVLPVLAVTTHQRNEVWRTEYTLWSDAAAKSPSPLVPVAYVHLGNYAKDAGRLPEAEGHFRRALEISPDHVAARNNLGIVLQGLGRVDEAIAIYDEITSQHPDLGEAWYNLGKAWQQLADGRSRQGDSDGALALEITARRAYRRAPTGGPHTAVILNNLGTTYERAGVVDSAAVFYQRSLAAQPDFDDARRNTDRLLRGLRDVASTWLDAGRHVELETLCGALIPAADLLGQRDPWPLFFLGVSRFYQGRYADSLEPTRQLLGQYPDFEEGYLQLGNLHETMGQPEQAAQVYGQHAVRVPRGTLTAESVARLQRLEAMR